MKQFMKGFSVIVWVFVALSTVEAKTAIKPEASPALQTAVDTQDVQIFTANNEDGKITPKTIEEAFVKEGFFISEHRDMNTPFVAKFKETGFDIYNLFTVYRKDTVRNLAVKYPEIGLFTPMSMSIYTKKGAKTISVAFLSAKTAARMMSIPEDHPEIVALEKSIITALHQAMPNGALEKVTYKMKKPEGSLVARATLLLEDDADWEEEKDDFQMEFEGSLAPSGFILAGFTDLGYDFEENNITAYLYYDTYSICKLEVIYVVVKKHPAAGAFAPCCMYMYQKKEEKEVHMAFPTVYKWIASLGIEDKESLDVLLDAQKKFEAILQKLTQKKK